MSQINRTSLREQIRDILLDRILSGHYQPGDRLLELQLAEEFGSSQGPVREAIRELAAQQMVVSESHRGTRVLGVTAQDLREINGVREALESHAILATDGRLDIDWSSLAAHADACYQAGAAGDRIAFSKHNVAFHRRIVEASGNRMLLKSWDDLHLPNRLAIATRQLAPSKRTMKQLARQHVEIAEALRSADGERGLELLRKHFQVSNELMMPREEPA